MTDFQQLKQNLSEKKLRERELAEQILEKKAALDEEILKLKTAFDNSNAELISDYQTAINELSEADKTLRSALTDNFHQTGVKTVDSQLSVRVDSKLVYDKNKAFKWAKEHNLALKLDEKAFEKIAGSTEIDFVIIEEKATAVVSKKI